MKGAADNDDVIESRAIPSKMEQIPDTEPVRILREQDDRR